MTQPETNRPAPQTTAANEFGEMGAEAIRLLCGERRRVDVVAGAAPVHVSLSTLKAVLDTLKVTASRITRGNNGFDQRQRSGIGRYLTQMDIARKLPNQTSDLFRSMPGVLMQDKIMVRGTDSTYCSPSIYLDGRFLTGISASDLDAIFNLNAVGAFIWERLDGRTPGALVVAALVEAFDVDEARARADYLSFLAQLQGLQAVDLAGPGAA